MDQITKVFDFEGAEIRVEIDESIVRFFIPKTNGHILGSEEWLVERT